MLIYCRESKSYDSYQRLYLKSHSDTLDTLSDKIPIDFTAVMSSTSTCLSLFQQKTVWEAGRLYLLYIVQHEKKGNNLTPFIWVTG